MNTGFRFLALLIVALCATASAAAQGPTCPVNGLNFLSYGQGCPHLGFTPPVLAGSYDAATCTVSLTVGYSPSCCNSFLSGRYLIVGGSAAQIPLPFSPGCILMAQPDFIIPLTPSLNPTLSFSLPPWLAPGETLFLQGANSFFTTVGIGTEVETTNGLLITTF